MKKIYLFFFFFFSSLSFGQNSTCEVTDQCIYTLRLLSVDGTGWNGNTMKITQNNQVILTVGENFTTGNIVDVNLFLCDDAPFELFWNEGGQFPEKVKVLVITSNANVVYIKEYDEGIPNTTLFSATAHCTTDCCFFYPFNLTVTEITETTALLSWQNEYNPVQWDIILLTDTTATPTDNDAFMTVNAHPFLMTDLQPCTDYKFYVRYRCSATSVGNWSEQSIIFSTECNLSLGFDKVNPIEIYPNPVINELTISSAQAIENIVIYDILGQKKYETFSSESTFKLTTEFLASGIYFIKISNSTESETFKIIKK